MSKPSVIIVGAGWAGLSAAVHLTCHHYPVTLLDAAPRPGGRARSISFGKFDVDNGQHLFIGAYHHLLELLTLIELNPESLFLRKPLALLMKFKNDAGIIQTIRLKAPKIKAPFHLVFGLLFAKGLSLKEKSEALYFCLKLKRHQFRVKQPTTVLSLLKTYQQSERLIKKLWEPIALAALSTPIHVASAQLFLTVLKDTFNHQTTDSDWLFAKADLSEILPTPCLRWLKKQGAQFHAHTRAQSLHPPQDNGLFEINTRSQTFTANHVILACPPEEAFRLIGPTQCPSLTQQLSAFQHEKIITVYLLFSHPIELDYPMIGSNAPHLQWVFQRSFAKQPNVLAIVHTGEAFSQMSSSQVIDIIQAELKDYFDITQPIQDYRMIREKRAAFTANIASDVFRPQNQTPMKNLWLAGDYTQTAYPATIEGAVLSGKNCAKALIEQKKTQS